MFYLTIHFLDNKIVLNGEYVRHHEVLGDVGLKE